MPDVFTHPFTFNDPNAINNSPGGKFLGDAIDSGNLSWMDILAPGSSYLWNTLDLTGKNAAQKQFENQKELDELAYMRNSAEAQKSRDWEKMMSDTSYQRAVKDLEAAGMNPYILMAQGLTGAPSYSGSSASTSSGTASRADNKASQVLGLIAVLARYFLTKGK